MGLVAYFCFMTALSVAAALLYTPSERLLAYVHCPRYYVVRRIDYLHYRSEKAHYLLRFVASCASVRAVRGAVDDPSGAAREAERGHPRVQLPGAAS